MVAISDAEVAFAVSASAFGPAAASAIALDISSSSLPSCSSFPSTLNPYLDSCLFTLILFSSLLHCCSIPSTNSLFLPAALSARSAARILAILSLGTSAIGDTALPPFSSCSSSDLLLASSTSLSSRSLLLWRAFSASSVAESGHRSTMQREKGGLLGCFDVVGFFFVGSSSTTRAGLAVTIVAVASAEVVDAAAPEVAAL